MKSNEIKILGILVLVVAAVVGLGIFLSRGSGGGKGQSGPGSTFVREYNHRRGSSEKVVIVEYGDFQCPACAQFYPEMEKVITEYNDKITFVFKHFPLRMHRNAMLASQAAEAAGSQGKFWEMYRKIYDSQPKWAESSNAQEVFVSFAKDLGLDAEKFSRDLQDGKIAENIRADMSDGQTQDVNATPSVFINGKLFNEVPTYQNLKKAIDQILKG